MYIRLYIRISYFNTYEELFAAPEKQSIPQSISYNSNTKKSQKKRVLLEREKAHVTLYDSML